MERASIQPMCVIEENARSGRSWVCASPLIAPIIVLMILRRTIGIVRLGGRVRLKSKRRGVNFCQVKRIDADGQDREEMVDGNH